METINNYTLAEVKHLESGKNLLSSTKRYACNNAIRCLNEKGSLRLLIFRTWNNKYPWGVAALQEGLSINYRDGLMKIISKVNGNIITENNQIKILEEIDKIKNKSLIYSTY